MKRTYRLITASIFFLSLIILTSAALAQERDYIEYEFPVIEPMGYLYGGYRFVDHIGSEKAGEYEYLHNSIALGGDLRVFSFPNKLSIDLRIRNQKDYFGEVKYAHKDVFYFRGINRTLFHNLDNLRLLDLDTTTLSPGVDVRDADRIYGITSGITSLFLRFKTPDFPSHFYISGNLLENSGTQQQRSLFGSGSFTSLVRASQRRDISRQARSIVVGANSHLGLVEIEVSHEEKRLDVNADKVLYDTYSDAGSPAGSTREGGIFPHNLTPELKGSTNTIHVHTSYTGGLVASATLSSTERENQDSKARSDYLTAAGNVIWMPMPRLTFFLRYKHKERDVEDQGAAALPEVCSPSNNIANNYACVIKPSISSETDTLSGILRYQPVKGVTLRTEYSYEETERQHADRRGLPESTRKDAVSLSSDMKIMQGLNLKVKYIHKEIEDPVYNTDPNRADEATFQIAYLPVVKVNTLLSYTISKERRNELSFNGVDAADRDVRRDRLMGSITSHVLNNLFITTSYAYMNNKTKQDIRYASSISPYNILTDTGVPYEDEAHNYAVGFHYVPADNLSLATDVSHTVMKGAFSPSEQDLLEPVSIATFSEFKAKETVFSASGKYRFKSGFTGGLRYKHIEWDEVTENPHDDIADGKAHVVLLTISKSW